MLIAVLLKHLLLLLGCWALLPILFVLVLQALQVARGIFVLSDVVVRQTDAASRLPLFFLSLILASEGRARHERHRGEEETIVARGRLYQAAISRRWALARAAETARRHVQHRCNHRLPTVLATVRHQRSVLL